jgi:AAA family ATP:ADP antiporter
VANGRLEKLLNRFADVRGHEAHAALYLSGFFFLITFSFYIVKPVKESFLIGLVNPAWWPYADLATALLIGFVVALNARLLNRLPRRTYISVTILFFIACLLVFWYAFDVYLNSLVLTPVADSSGGTYFVWIPLAIMRAWPVPVFVFCFWTDVFIAMFVTQFWIAVNDVFDPYQAKRLVGLFVTGGLFGGIAGSSLAALMVFARIISAENLLLVCPVILLLALIMVNLVYREQKHLRETAEVEVDPVQAGARVGYWESFLSVKRSRYLRLLAATLASAMVAGSLINFQFKFAVNKIFLDRPDDRTFFLAVFFLGILVLSTVFHLATTGRILKSFGIGRALLVAPVLLLAGSLSVFLVPAGALLVWASLIRGGDKLFDNTISQSLRELLYIPVPADIKYKAKIFIDMFVNKFATGLGAGLYWGLYRLSGFAYKDEVAKVRELGILVVVFLVLWIALTRAVYAEYPAVLKKDIRRKWDEGDKIVSDNVDVDLTRDVFDALQSRERSTTLYLMNVFDLVRKNNLTPELKEALGIKQDEIRARSMDCLFDVGGEVLFQGLDEAIVDKDFASVIDLVFLLPSYQEVMGKRLAEDAGSASEVDRMDAAKLIGLMVRSPETLRFLERFLQDPSPEVVTYALRSAAVHRRAEHVPLILRQLGNPLVALEAQGTLTDYGPGVEDQLKSALGDESEASEVRRAIPVVLARFGTQRSADILLDELARRRDDVEQELIDGLYKIRADRPAVRFRDKIVQPEILFLIEKSYAIVLNAPGRAPGDAPAGLTSEAKAALDIKIKRVFDLMTLLHPPEDIVKACQNILQGTRKSVDYSLSLLDDLLDRELKALLFPLIEDLPPEERAQRMKKAMRLK